MYVARVLLEYIIVVSGSVYSKHQSMVFYSSTLRRVPCVSKNWSSVPLPTFLSTKINKDRTKTTPKNIFRERHLYNGRYTQLTCLSEACQALRYDCQFAFHFLQTAYFYQLWKLLYPRFQRKAFPMNIYILKT